MGIQEAWLIPTYGFLAFGIISMFGRLLPFPAKYLSVLAIALGFLTFWPVLFDFVDRGVSGYVVPRVWFTAGDISVGSGMIIDSLSIVMLAMVTFVAMLIQIYSLGYMRHEHSGRTVDDPNISWYFAVHSLFVASMLTLILADNLLVLYVGWELVGLCSYLLIGFWWKRPSAVKAAKKAFITTRIGDVGLLIGILMLASETGTFNIPDILSAVIHGELSDTMVTWSALFIFLGAMGKSAQFPLHVWLPDAMEGPTPVSALIHAATMVTAGVFLVARMLPLFEASEAAQLVVAVVGIITALMGASLALVVTDLKRILAYSTMSHLGFMMLALGGLGFTAAIFHLLMHGIAKAMLFLTAGSIMHSMHDETDITKMGGLRKRMPITAITFTIGALSLAGIVPLSGFWSKDEILLVVKDDLNPVFLVLFLIAIVMSAMYMARAIYLVFYGPLKEENRNVHESPLVMTVPLMILGGLSIVAGFVFFPLFEYGGIGAFLYHPTDQPHEFGINSIEWSAISIVLATGALAVGIWMYKSHRSTVDSLRTSLGWLHHLLINRYYMDTAYQFMVDKVVLTTGRGVAWFDRRGVNDQGVNRSGQVVVLAGKWIRYHVTGLFADYGLAMVGGMCLIVLYLWLGMS